MNAETSIHPVDRASVAGPWRGATSRRSARVALLAAALVLSSGPWLQAAESPATPPTRPARPAASTGSTVVVPDRFLRRWDPLTVFFAADLGPSSGGPEDHPERVVSITPAQPGAFTWLDARTLQFQPAEPWPALARVTVKAAEGTFRLSTLLSPPIASQPSAGAEGLAPVDEIALTFSEPLPDEALARALAIEIRPLPGFGEGGARALARDDFAVKRLERGKPSDPATYVLSLRQPIALGQRVTVRFRLSLDEAPDKTFAELVFATAEPFRALRFGCRIAQLPVVPGGARYTAEQALACEDGDPAVVVDFSALPRELGPVAARNLVRLSPTVPNLEAKLSGKRLELRGDFARETAYRISLAPTPLTDERGRKLDLQGPNELTLAFPRAPSYLRLASGFGLAERNGPQMIPVTGRGDERVDLRLHRIEPLDRSFWPFGDVPVEVDEGERPPGPGERPEPWKRADSGPPQAELARRIAALGSPPISALVDLPLRRDGGTASFGLDLGPHLARLAGAGEPGTYLVGLRRLGASEKRSWMRLQVSDLALTTLEEPHRVVFAVTSLASALPVAGAQVTVEGTEWAGSKASWVELFRGSTDGTGQVVWTAPGPMEGGRRSVRRIVVSRGNDTLVLDPEQAPDGFADNRWSRTYGDWLAWTQESLDDRGAHAERLAHLFTERPVYRPDEPVHVKAFLRTRSEGHLEPIADELQLVIEGPGDLVWRYRVTPNALGSVYWKFDEKDLPTGTYRAHFEPLDGGEEVSGAVAFRKEAYRLPRFEVRLDGPDRAPLDRELDVKLTATYYAGGRVAARPIEWRVTQFPYDWSPKTRPGFLFSSDSRFSRESRFESTPAIEQAGVTDEDGGAKLTINPAIEPTSQPRTYVVEATVVDADDMTVSATRQVVALPPILLGLKVPRYVERAGTLRPQILVLGPDDKPVAGQSVTVRLSQRRWHSYLRASDFSDGVARYITEVVDEKLSESVVTSGTDALDVPLDLPEAGVYVVELEARDRLGRAQTMAVDLFAGGGEPVAWPKPATAVFQVTPDKARYEPGTTARLVLQSPFQSGEALCVVEAPDGNRYSWLPVRGGQAVFELPVDGSFTPRVPVHFLLLRGRLPGSAPVPGNATDLGRPATFGATVWLDVEPTAHRLSLELAYPAQARPAQEIDVAITLKDPAGKPLAGEVTLWLVDQAVLALGREQRLDPVPSFLTAVTSYFSARDTRSLVFGYLPFAKQPGGDEGEESKSLLDRQTVRKNFQPVPYYNPAIAVGPDGVARVKVKLPDDLTNFMLRAKAVAGNERLGFATGKIEVRQPVVLQPSLPRFVRPGDLFSATAVGRLLEGAAGAGRAEARLEGLEPRGETHATFEWTANRPTRLDFPVSVPTPGYDAEGRLTRREVVVRMGAERTSDNAGDAFEVRLPIRDDRDRVVLRALGELKAGEAWKLPEPTEATRPGSLKRKLLVSNDPALAAMSAGLDFLLAYPYGCTEQRLAATRAQVALKRFRELLHLEGGEKQLDRAVADTMAWLPLVQQPSGLLSYWPGGSASVSLTAWAAEFLAEARDAGYTVDAGVEERALRALAQALRSDYAGFLDGEAWAERTWALRALARSGKFDPAYGNELARRAQMLDLENVASVLTAFDRAGKGDSPALPPLEETLWKGFVVRLWQGRETYGGLQTGRRAASSLILPSETRTIAEMTRALVPRASGAEEEKRLAILSDALVALGRGDGWGSTNANAAAILALSELLAHGRPGVPDASATLRTVDGERHLALSEREPTAYWTSTRPGAAELMLAATGAGKVLARAEASYLPAADGSQAAARRDGFVVTREQLVLRGEAAPGSAIVPERIALDQPGKSVALTVGEVVEEHVQVVNPQDRTYVAVAVPLAAGFEPLNPNLETAPPEAKPAGQLTMAPTYASYLDDQVTWYFDSLPKGTYDFYFRVRAQIPGSFIQPPAKAEAMYDASQIGTSPGARVEVKPKP